MAQDAIPVPAGETRRPVVVALLGCMQILAWGSTFYLLPPLARSIVDDTGWPYDRVMAGLALGLFAAGLVSPRTGRLIARHGGRRVLAGGALLVALGLVIVGSADSLPAYLAGWIVLGAGMGASLYDAAFATLGALYGTAARGPIAAVTLYGGFASTVCWPFSAWLVGAAGWRGACLAYAAIHIALGCFGALLVIPSRRPEPPAAPREARAADGLERVPFLRNRNTLSLLSLAHVLVGEPASTSPEHALAPGERLVFALLCAALTIGAAILSLVGSQLITLLTGSGLSLAQAVGLGMIIGPAAVGARAIETLAGPRYHPIWTMVASVTLVGGGAMLFFTGPAAFAVAIASYAAGNGIGSIAKGTLPLALFGAARYPALAGLIARPVLVAMSLAPYVGAWSFQAGGVRATLTVFAGLAATNVVLVATLLWLTRARRSVERGA
jgi:MFS family permease